MDDLPPIQKSCFLDKPWNDKLEIDFDQESVAISNPEGIWVTDCVDDIRKISALLAEYADLIEKRQKND